MSRKSKKPTKQHGSDKTYITKNGTYYTTAVIHQGRLSRRYQGPERVSVEAAVESFNNGLYRNLED